MAMNKEEQPNPRDLLDSLYRLCESRLASDIHLSAGEFPYLRLDGVLTPVSGLLPISAETCDALGVMLALNTVAPGLDDPEVEIRR